MRARRRSASGTRAPPSSAGNTCGCSGRHLAGTWPRSRPRPNPRDDPWLIAPPSSPRRPTSDRTGNPSGVRLLPVLRWGSAESPGRDVPLGRAGHPPPERAGPSRSPRRAPRGRSPGVTLRVERRQSRLKKWKRGRTGPPYLPGHCARRELLPAVLSGTRIPVTGQSGAFNSVMRDRSWQEQQIVVPHRCLHIAPHGTIPVTRGATRRPEATRVSVKS